LLTTAIHSLLTCIVFNSTEFLNVCQIDADSLFLYESRDSSIHLQTAIWSTEWRTEKDGGQIQASH